MQLRKTVKSFSIEDSNIIKGVGILLIAFHNFFHWIQPFARENEFNFSIHGIENLFKGIENNPLEGINLLFSFWGHFGVQLFIFISGYGLMRAYHNKKIKWGSFISKRINKLWPTFFFALFLFYSLFRIFYYNLGIEFGVIQAYVLKITFLSNFIPNEIFSLNGPWWFYSMIVQLYLVFPLLLTLQKKFGSIALIILSALMYLLTYIYNPWFISQGSSLYFFFVANIPVFSLGIILGSKETIKYNHIIVVVAFVLFILGNFFTNFWYISHLMFTIIGLSIIYFLILQSKRKLFFYKIILFYGEISMYLFAIHGFLRPPFIALAKKHDNPLMTIVWALVFMAVATIAALALKWVIINYLKLLSILSKWVRNISSSTFNFLINGTKTIMQYGLVFLTALIVLRIYEYILLHYHHSIQIIDISSFANIVFRDLLFGIGLLGFLLLPYLLIFRLSKITAKTIFIIIFNLFIIINIALIQYYDLTLTLLDRVIYAYSWESILELSNTNSYNSLTILPFILISFAFTFSIFYANRIKFKKLFILLFPVAAFMLAVTHNNFIPKENNYDSELEYLYANNKLIYFVKDIIRYKPTEDLNLSEIGTSLKGYRKVFNERTFLSLHAPFLRVPDQGDPIGPFFRKTSNGNPPNIVFIIVESLCTPVSGHYTYKTSFTPFLDSLTEHSLYWRNNLATSERTFGVLPSLLASLPYGKKGFLDMNLDMPEHKSIINVLKSNKYTSRFFYGGWPHFNNMDVYMNLNKTDTIINQFAPQDSIPPNENGFSWGYSDRAILQSTFETIKDSTDAYISIYLTLSTHSPFMLKNNSYYMQRVIDHIDTLDILDKDMPSYIKNQQKLATFLFFDDELRKFFEKYKQRRDYENTIFVITGDHRGIIFFRTSQIDVYHTPLIIYSPLLKNGREFGGVTSHADLTPTILNYLEYNYDINLPKEVSWLGGLLDTSFEFHSQQRMAFMRNNRDIRDYIHGNYYLATDNLYELSDTMHLKKINNDNIKNQLKQELSDFKNLNQFSFISLQNQTKSKVIEVISEKLDFESTIPIYFQNDISQDTAFSGKTSILMKKEQEYGSFYPSIFLEEGIGRVYIEISFKALVSKNGKQNPSFIIALSENDKSLSWESIHFMNYNFGTEKNWKTYKISKTVFLDPDNSKGNELKLYLWNRHQAEMYYDDININIKVKKYN